MLKNTLISGELYKVANDGFIFGSDEWIFYPIDNLEKTGYAKNATFIKINAIIMYVGIFEVSVTIKFPKILYKNIIGICSNLYLLKRIDE